MKLGEIAKFTGAQYEEFIKETMAAQNEEQERIKNRFKKGSTRLKPLKIEGNTCYTLFIPIEMALPFNPFNLSDDKFSSKRPFVMPGTVSAVVAHLKDLAKEQPEFKERLVTLLGVDESAIDFDNPKIKNTEERMIWHRWARIQYISEYTQAIWLDSTKKFPSKVGFNPIFDEDGEICGSVGVGYDFYKMETDLINLKIQAETEKYAPGGEKEKEPKKNLETYKDSLWDERIIRNPYIESHMRIIAFKCEKPADGAVSEADVKTFNSTKSLVKFMYTLKIAKEDITLYEEAFGSKNTDIHDDFIEYQLKVPEADPNDEMLIYRKQSRVAVNTVTTCANENEPKDHFKPDMLHDAYADLFNDTDAVNNKELKKAIYAFRTINNNVIVGAMRDNIKKYETVMANSSILSKYNETISLISDELKNKVALDLMDGEGEAVNLDIKPEIVQPTLDSETTVYNGGVGEELTALMDDLDEDDDSNSSEGSNSSNLDDLGDLT